MRAKKNLECVQSKWFKERERVSQLQAHLVHNSLRNFPSTDKWPARIHPSSSSIGFRTFQRRENLEGNLSKITPRLVDLWAVTQTRDEGIKGRWYHGIVKPDDRATGYSNIVNPCLPKNRSIYRDREIFQDLPFPIASKSWCNLGQARLSHVYSNRAYYSTRVARILASSQRERDREGRREGG